MQISLTSFENVELGRSKLGFMVLSPGCLLEENRGTRLQEQDYENFGKWRCSMGWTQIYATVGRQNVGIGLISEVNTLNSTGF